MPGHCRKSKHITAWLRRLHEVVHVLGYEGGVQLSGLEGRMLTQALQERHISGQPTHLQTRTVHQTTEADRSPRLLLQHSHVLLVQGSQCHCETSLWHCCQLFNGK